MLKIEECRVKYGFDNMDFIKVSSMLSQAFWSPNITIDEVKQGAVHSALIAGVFYNDKQIGYARVISDKTRFAYILDVYVDKNYRKKGVGQLMINSILQNDELKDVYQWLLITKDAHGVYSKAGFKVISRPDDWMEIRHQRPKRQKVQGDSRVLKGMLSVRAADICSKLKDMGDSQRALAVQRFFKTAPGEYGEGDVFVGLNVPAVRKLAKEYQALPLNQLSQLLKSAIHEARLLALLILIRQYASADETGRQQIYNLYLQNTRFINNWDLVDASAMHIVGAHLRNRPRSPLSALAESKLLWDRRISIMATFHYIKRGEFAETLRIALLLLHDQEDLIQKAVGWMLRETGKRDQLIAENFLQEHYKTMPRTMLRYAIEKFPEKLRRQYLRGEI